MSKSVRCFGGRFSVRGWLVMRLASWPSVESDLHGCVLEIRSHGRREFKSLQCALSRHETACESRVKTTTTTTTTTKQPTNNTTKKTKTT